MSGITGVLMRTGEPVDHELVEAMAAATPHRAPDGQWAIRDPSFSAIRQRTITTSEDEAEQDPVRDRASGIALLFDGRLDNRDDIIDALRLPPEARVAWPDAWLALEAWKKWGADTPARILGDFALVCWNPSERSLFCARDVMGVRPLFYFLSNRVLVFGSELRQLLAHPLVPREPDEATVGGLLAGSLSRASERTLYRDVRRLPHAHALSVGPTTATTIRYWQLDYSRELQLRNDDEYADALRDVFDKSVDARLRSRGPVGAYLSGGLDSSSVVVTASRRPFVGPPFAAFSLVFPSHPEADEREYSEAVLRHASVPGIQLMPRSIDRDDVEAQVAARLELPDFPHDYTGNAVRSSMAARSIRVALTGSGGDIGLSGSLFHYADLLRRGRLIRFLRRYRDAARQPAMGWTSADLLPCAVWPLLPYAARRLLRPAARRLGRVGVPRWIGRDFADRAGLTAERPLRRIPAGRLARTDISDGFENGWTHMALDMYQRGSLEWSIEDRHPFFDRRAIEFALSLPDEQRWQNGQTRNVLRRAMGERLPEQVRERPDSGKGDFSHVYPGAIEALGGERFFADAMATARNGWVVASEARAMYGQMRALRGAGNPTYSDVAFRLWVIAAIEIWYSAVFVGQPGRDRWNRIPNATSSIERVRVTAS